jgi:hypothetical protein
MLFVDHHPTLDVVATCVGALSKRWYQQRLLRGAASRLGGSKSRQPHSLLMLFISASGGPTISVSEDVCDRFVRIVLSSAIGFH